jgi:hypothetical protein
MNAHELALHLQVESSQAEYGYVVDDWKLLDDAATMLRQQADRIAELEKRIVALTMNLNTKAIKVSELERQLKNV